MRKIVEYSSVVAVDHGQGTVANLEELKKLVNAAIKEGWQPIGGIVPADNNLLLAQAMVKYEEADPCPKPKKKS